MKILHLINSTNPAGGGPIESIVQANRMLCKNGHELVVACLDKPESPWLKSFDFEIVALGPAYTPYRYCPSYHGWLFSRAREFDAAIIHGLWLHVSAGAWLCLRKVGVPYFVYVHGMLDPAFKDLFPCRHVMKLLIWKMVEWRVLRDAAAVLFTCAEEKKLALGSFSPFRCNSEVVPYCVGEPPPKTNSQIEAFRSLLPHKCDERILLFLSRIHPKKGCDVLIEAFAQAARNRSGWRLVMAEPDVVGWRADLQKRSARLGIADKVTWLDMLQGDAKWGAFRSAECFVLPSHQENFGIAVVESLASGTPVIISNRVNIWREISDDGAGYAGDNNIRTMSSLMSRFMNISKEQHCQMRLMARLCYENRFSPSVAAARFIDALAKYPLRP